MCNVRPKIREGIKSEVWIFPHEHNCDSYYVAERWKNGILRGITYSDNLNFWQIGALSQEQAQNTLNYRRSLGEEIDEVWANCLPEGARWLNTNDLYEKLNIERTSC